VPGLAQAQASLSQASASGATGAPGPRSPVPVTALYQPAHICWPVSCEVTSRRGGPLACKVTSCSTGPRLPSHKPRLPDPSPSKRPASASVSRSPAPASPPPPLAHPLLCPWCTLWYALCTPTGKPQVHPQRGASPRRTPGPHSARPCEPPGEHRVLESRRSPGPSRGPKPCAPGAPGVALRGSPQAGAGGGAKGSAAPAAGPRRPKQVQGQQGQGQGQGRGRGRAGAGAGQGRAGAGAGTGAGAGAGGGVAGALRGSPGGKGPKGPSPGPAVRDVGRCVSVGKARVEGRRGYPGQASPPPKARGRGQGTWGTAPPLAAPTATVTVPATLPQMAPPMATVLGTVTVLAAAATVVVVVQ